MNELKKIMQDMRNCPTELWPSDLEKIADRLEALSQTHVLIQTVPAGWKMVAVPIDPLCDGCSEAECDKCCPKGHCTHAAERAAAEPFAWVWIGPDMGAAVSTKFEYPGDEWADLYMPLYTAPPGKTDA